MAKAKKALLAFNRGVVSPLLDSRSDLAPMASAARTADNMIVEREGGLIRRPGLRFIASIKGSSTEDTEPFAALEIDDTVYDIGHFSNGDAIVVGSFVFVNPGVARQGWVKVDKNGNVAAALPAIDVGPHVIIVVDPGESGWALVGGEFTTVGGLSRRGVAAINHDGTHRTAFPDMVMDGRVEDGWLDEAGRVVLVGSFTTVAGESHGGVVRILTDGTIDPAWNAVTVANNPGVWRAAPASSNRLLYPIVQPGITTINAAAQNQCAALFTAAGVVDATFAPPSTDRTSGIHRGISGWFYRHSFGSGGVARVRRFNLSAALDGGFVPAIGPNDSSIGVWTVLEVSASRVIVGGDFTTVGGVSMARLACLDDSGAVRADWAGGTPSANALVLRLRATAGGAVWVCGDFDSINGQTRHHLAKINALTGAVYSTPFL